MAAVYLHNAIFAPEQPELASESPQRRTISTTITATHGKNEHLNNRKQTPQRPRRIRSLSAGSLRTVPSDNSHPTEPLLRSTTSESIAYKDLLSRQPPHPDGPQAGWDVGLNLEGDPPTPRETRMVRERILLRRLRRFRIAKAILEVIFAVWALYNVVRYFLAYNIYDSQSGQNFSLALGTSATLSLAFVTSAALISFFRHYLLMHHIPIGSILFVHTVLQYLFSTFLLTPAFVSFILTFKWHKSSDPELRLVARCHIDVDPVWSVPKTPCTGSSSAPGWFALTSLRFIFTAFAIALYLIVSQAYHAIRRPSRRYPSARRRSTLRDSGLAFESFRRSSPSSPFRPLAGCQTTPLPSPPSSLPRYPQTSASSTRDPSSSSRTLTNNSPLSVDKELPPMPEFDMYANFDPAMPLGADETLPDSNGNSWGSGGLQGFVNGFRSLVAQITRETEQGMILAQPDTELGLPPSHGGAGYHTPWSPDDATFNPYAGYTYSSVAPHPQPEERVRMMGHYVRRMPTIESLGSRETGESKAHQQRRRSQPGSPTSVSRRVSAYSTLSSSGSSRLSGYFSNVGHAMIPPVVEGEASVSFHTAVNNTVSELHSTPSPTSSSEPPPVPPKDPPLAHIL